MSLFPAVSVVAESSRSSALQEAKAQIGVYDFIAVGTSLYLRRVTQTEQLYYLQGP